MSAIWLVMALLAACGGVSPDHRSTDESTVHKSSPEAARPTILLIGTSITAGYGLSPEDAWSSRLQGKIDSAGLHHLVVNAGVSGETSAGALRRLEWLLAHQAPAIVVVETGANDGLRGLDLDSLEANLDAMLTRIDRIEPRPVVVVAAMEAPPNLGSRYANRFRAIFPKLARAHGAMYLPFLLDGVAGNARFNQADGIHPNEAGSEIVAENVWATLRETLK
ncbi:MAG TPA: arylesterase [Gemmatimonadales bacterium]|nr:arylesterase [Gemmatimonadales bacterium]